MNKKKDFMILSIICVVFICLIVVSVVLDGKGKVDYLEDSESSETDDSDRTDETGVNDEEYRYNRDIIIKDITLNDRDSGDIIISDVKELNQEIYYIKTSTPFSNGIAIQSTEYVTVGAYGGEKVECMGDDGVTIIHVSEINPLDFTPESKKNNHLNHYWQSYIAYEGKGFVRNDTELDVGLNEDVDAYNRNLGTDPTIIDGIQLLMDTTIETAVGKGYVLEEYSQYSKKYTLHAYIDCGNFRYLEVNIDSTNEDTLIGYLHDLMNNGTYIIE